MADNEAASGGYTEQQWKYIYAGGGTVYTLVVVGLMVIAPAIPGMQSPLDVKCSNAFDGDGGATVGIGIFLGLLGSIMINTGASLPVAALRSAPSLPENNALFCDQLGPQKFPKPCSA